MTIHLQTARLVAGNPDGKATLVKGPASFTARGWDEFQRFLRTARPEVTDLATRLQAPVEDFPTHPSYLLDGAPMRLAWTADECRRLFVALAGASDGAGREEYDFWEFTALVCSGIVEDGICVY